MTSRRVDRAALDAQLTRFIDGLRWPAAASDLAAVPVESCATPLRLREARVVRDDVSNVLMNLLGGIVAADAERAQPV